MFTHTHCTGTHHFKFRGSGISAFYKRAFFFPECFQGKARSWLLFSVSPKKFPVSFCTWCTHAIRHWHMYQNVCVFSLQLKSFSTCLLWSCLSSNVYIYNIVCIILWLHWYNKQRLCLAERYSYMPKLVFRGLKHWWIPFVITIKQKIQNNYKILHAFFS